MSEAQTLPTHPSVPHALVTLARAQGRRLTAEGLLHGLSAKGGQVSLSDIGETAKRAGFRLVPLDPQKVQKSHCPLVLMHADGRCVIVTDIKAGGVITVLSGSGETATVPGTHATQAGFRSMFSAVPSSASPASAESTSNDFSWFTSSLWPGWDTLRPVVAATIMINLLALAVPLISMNIMDRVVSHAAFETLWALTLGGLGAISIDFLLRTLRGSLVDQAAARSDVVLSNQVFRRVIGARLTNQQTSVGIKTNSLREYESLREIYNSMTLTALGDLPFALLFFFVVWLVAGPLVLVLVFMAPVLLLTGYLSQWGLGKLSREHFKDNAHKNALAIELITGIESIKSNCAESWAASKWETVTANHLRHSLGMRWWSALGNNLVMAQQNLTTIGVLVAGVYLVVAKEISPGALFATIMLGGRALTPVMQLSGLIAKLHHAKTAYQAIKQLANVEQDRPEGVQFVACPSALQPIALHNVDMAYRDDAPQALRNLSLTIMPGEKIGIIGGIGSGKSTLIQLILGLRSPTGGSITMAGTPISRIEPAQYRRLFGTALQDSAFFSGTILENLVYHRTMASEAEITDALTLSGALGWISQLPSGVSTHVSEHGRNFSSGQRQTLALARAFLGSPQALILDEPTSDLDGRSEMELVQRLRRLPAATTLICVSHRPAVLDACQRLIVLDRGTLVVDGEKSAVLARLRQTVQGQNTALEAAS